MSIMTIETTITRKYLFGKSKSDLAYMYLELLERAVQAEAERDAAQARSGGKSIALEDLRAELERVKAERNALVRDAWALAKIARDARYAFGEPPTDDEASLIKKYLEAAK